MMADDDQRGPQRPEVVHASIVAQVYAPASRGAVECIDDFDDLYQCGLASAQRAGLMDAFSEAFDPGACCSVAERALLEDIRSFLRPAHAPAHLVRKCLDCLNECNGDDCADDCGCVAGDEGEEIPIAS